MPPAGLDEVLRDLPFATPRRAVHASRPQAALLTFRAPPGSLESGLGGPGLHVRPPATHSHYLPIFIYCLAKSETHLFSYAPDLCARKA